MPVSLADRAASVAALHSSPLFDNTGIRAETERAALVDIVALPGHKIYDLVLTLLVKLSRVCVGNAGNRSCILNYGNLHTEADSEIRNEVLSCVFCRKYHTLYSSAAEAARDENSVEPFELIFIIFGGKRLRIYPVDLYMSIVIISGVAKRLGYREVGIVKTYVLTYKTYLHGIRS